MLKECVWACFEIVSGRVVEALFITYSTPNLRRRPLRLFAAAPAASPSSIGLRGSAVYSHITSLSSAILTARAAGVHEVNDLILVTLGKVVDVHHAYFPIGILTPP